MKDCFVQKLKAVVHNDNLENLYYDKLQLVQCQGTPFVSINSNGTPYYIEEGGEKTEYNTTSNIVLPTNGGVLWVPKYTITAFTLSSSNSGTQYSPSNGFNASEFFNSTNFPELYFLVLNNIKNVTGDIMTFSNRPLTRLQINSSTSDVTGELKDFIKAQCQFRTSGTLIVQLHCYATFDGKRGAGGTSRGDVNGTITYSATGATFVCTGGTAVKGTYEYTKATDTWVKTAD